MNDDQRQEWLDSLEEGETVALERRIGYNRDLYYNVTKVAKITPTRRIKLAHGDYQFDSKGRPYGRETFSVKLVPYDQRVKDAARKRALLFEIDKMKVDNMSVDQLERIAAIIKESS